MLRRLDDAALARVAVTLAFYRFFILENYEPVAALADNMVGRLDNINRRYQRVKEAMAGALHGVELSVRLFLRVQQFFNLLFIELPSLASSGVRLLKLLGDVKIKPASSEGVRMPPTI